MCIDKSDGMINKYNNTNHDIIKMSVDVNLKIYIDFNKENNSKGPKFKVADNVRISKYKNIFGLKTILRLKNLKTQCRERMLFGKLTEQKL